MELTVKGYGICDEINLEYLKCVLFHELKHAYQTSLYIRFMAKHLNN